MEAQSVNAAPQDYQDEAHAVFVAVYSLLSMIGATQERDDGTYEGGAIVQGGLIGLLRVWAESGDDEETIRRELDTLLDNLLPQVVFAHAAHGLEGGCA